MLRALGVLILVLLAISMVTWVPGVPVVEAKKHHKHKRPHEFLVDKGFNGTIVIVNRFTNDTLVFPNPFGNMTRHWYKWVDDNHLVAYFENDLVKLGFHLIRYREDIKFDIYVKKNIRIKLKDWKRIMRIKGRAGNWIIDWQDLEKYIVENSGKGHGHGHGHGGRRKKLVIPAGTFIDPLVIYNITSGYYVLDSPDDIVPAVILNSPLSGVTLYTVDKWYSGTILPDYALMIHCNYQHDKTGRVIAYEYIIKYTVDDVIYTEHFLPNTGIISNVWLYNYTSGDYTSFFGNPAVAVGIARRGENVTWISGSLPYVLASTTYGTVKRGIVAVNTTALPADFKTDNEVKVKIEIRYTVPGVSIVQYNGKYYAKLELVKNPIKLTLEQVSLSGGDIIAPHLYDWWFDGVDDAVVFTVTLSGSSMDWIVWGNLVDYNTANYNKIGGFGTSSISHALWIEDERYEDTVSARFNIFNATDGSYVTFFVIKNKYYGVYGEHRVHIDTTTFAYYFNGELQGSHNISAYTGPDYYMPYRAGATSYGLGARTNYGGLSVTDYVKSIIGASAIYIDNKLVSLVSATFYNGTHYFDIVTGKTATVYGNPQRIPANTTWLWLVKGLASDDKLHFRFFPYGTKITVKDADGNIVQEFTITGVANGAGLVEDYAVSLPNGNYTIEATVPALGEGDVVAPHLYDWWFDGVDDYVEVPDSPSLTFSNQLTVATLFYLDKDLPSSTHSNLVSRINLEFRFRVDRSGKYWFLANNGTAYEGILLSTSASNRVYEYAAVTFDSGLVKLYINGVCKESKTMTITSIADTTTPVYIGAYSYTTAVNEFWRGRIAFVTIYNTVLSDTEITSNYNHIVDSSGLVLFLDPTFYNGTTYLDLSGNNNHGTPYNGVQRIPTKQTWLWLVKSLENDGKLHFRFVPNGTIIRFLDAKGAVLKEVVVTGTVNGAGLVEDYVVEPVADAVKVEVLLPWSDDYAVVSYEIDDLRTELTSSLFIQFFDHSANIAPKVPPKNNIVWVLHPYYGTNITFEFKFTGFVDRIYLIDKETGTIIPSALVPLDLSRSDIAFEVHRAPSDMPVLLNISTYNLTRIKYDPTHTIMDFGVYGPTNQPIIVVIDPGDLRKPKNVLAYGYEIPERSSYEILLNSPGMGWYYDVKNNLLYIKAIPHSEVPVYIRWSRAHLLIDTGALMLSTAVGMIALVGVIMVLSVMFRRIRGITTGGRITVADVKKHVTDAVKIALAVAVGAFVVTLILVVAAYLAYVMP